MPRTNLALGFAQYTPSDQKLFTREQLDDKMCMTLGGRAAEALTFDRITTGAQNDLEKVTKIAYAQVTKFGMNKQFGLMSVAEQSEPNQTDEKPFSKALEAIVDNEVRKIVQVVYQQAEDLLRNNQDKLKAVSAVGGVLIMWSSIC